MYNFAEHPLFSAHAALGQRAGHPHEWFNALAGIAARPPILDRRDAEEGTDG
jgi:hypothetical protein